MRRVFQSDRVRVFARCAFPFVVFAVCLGLLAEQVSAGFWQDLPLALNAIPASVWTGAAIATAVSFWAVGRYDRVAHQHLQTGVGALHAQASGMISIAVAQTLGLGLFTGALARWRILPSLSLKSALTLSAFVSGSFIIGWALVTAIACLVLPAPDWTFWPSLAVALGGIALLFCLVRWPVMTVFGRAIHLPTLKQSGAILLWSAVDMAFAATALWLLLPAQAEIGVVAFMPIYMVALGAALISNTPGGVGPFELVLIAALPGVAPEALMLSVVAFRLVYYAFPACLGVLGLIRPFPSPLRQETFPLPAHVLREAPRSEVGVILQNGGYLARTRAGLVAMWPTGQTITALFDPVRGSYTSAAFQLMREAENSGRIPLMYKASARLALEARKREWPVLHIADDAHIHTHSYSLETPKRRTLRRKLRSVQKMGLQIEPISEVPADKLAEVDRKWTERYGHARGGTMGRFSEDFVKTQFGLVASCKGEVVAFVTFFVSRNEWALDIMRQTENAPAGTMHALVHQAIETAKTRGVPIVSLAATPACPDPTSAFWRFVSMQVVAGAGGMGLRQFKSSFAPVWRPRYAAAPSRLELAIALFDIIREVHDPRPILPHNFEDIHDLHENYEFASRHIA